jgi:protein SCO1/2/putative membrane protein
MKSGGSAYWIGLFIVVMSGVVFAATLVGSRVQLVSDGLAIKHLRSPEFRFTERSGEPFGSDELKGKVWIADFVFTRCGGPCPIMTRRMSDLQAELSELEAVHFVSFSVDPERDTPEVLRQYAETYGAGPRWWFLTGDRTEIYRTCEKGFLLAVVDQRRSASKPLDDTMASEPGPQRDDSDYEHVILHRTDFVLVDHLGRIRGYYDGTDAERMDDLERAVYALERDTRISSNIAILPAVNATLNASCTLLLIIAFAAIKLRNIKLHVTLMLAACVTSALFLAGYLTYHAFAGSTRFAADGPVRYVYYTVLLTHVVLAAAIVPLVVTTLYRAARRQFDRHRRIARVTYPLWLYVSITGVWIYWMLYHAYPPPGLTL